MYEYPFGNGQQLNLDWFLAEWKNLLAAWEAEKNGIAGALDAEIAKAEAALADVFAARDAAAQSAANALESKNAAAQSASDASGYLATVRADANTARDAARNAAQSESNAADSAKTAVASKNAAGQSERNAAQSEANANSSKKAAAQSASDADASKSAAAQSASDADASKSAAAQSAEDAENAASSVEDSAQQIATNTTDIANLKESINNVGISNIVKGPEPNAKNVKELNEIIAELPFNENGYTQARICTYGKQLYNEKIRKNNTGLNDNGIEESSSGYWVIGPIYITNEENIFLWFHHTGSGRIGSIFAYDENDVATKILGFNYTGADQNRNAAIPNGTKYIKIQIGSSTTDLRISFYRTAFIFTLPENFYGGYISLPSGVIKSIYSANGQLLPTPVETETTVRDISKYDGNITAYAYTTTQYERIGITELEYTANTKGYIDDQNTLVKAIIAPVLDSMIADTALDVNDFRIVDNILYRVTASIAGGGTLTVNTNVVATTVTDILKSLLN